MQSNEPHTEDRAVSPVIGVVLMVAVTVILAAIVAAFALGMGGNASSTPQASFDYDYASGTVNVTHVGGDPLDPARVTVQKNGGDAGVTFNDYGGDGDISTGDDVSFSANSGDTIRIVWEGSNGKTATVSTYEVP